MKNKSLSLDNLNKTCFHKLSLESKQLFLAQISQIVANNKNEFSYNCEHNCGCGCDCNCDCDSDCDGYCDGYCEHCCYVDSCKNKKV